MAADGFHYHVRGSQLSTDPNEAVQVEQRDQQLEQFLWAPYGHVCLLKSVVDQTILSPLSVVSFETKEHDPEQMTDSVSRITTAIAGIWRFTAGFMAEITAEGGYQTALRKTAVDSTITYYGGSGGIIAFSAGVTGGTYQYAFDAMIPMSVNDYVEVVYAPEVDTVVLGDPGSTLISPIFQAEFVSYIKESGPQTT